MGRARQCACRLQGRRSPVMPEALHQGRALLWHLHTEGQKPADARRGPPPVLRAESQWRQPLVQKTPRLAAMTPTDAATPTPPPLDNEPDVQELEKDSPMEPVESEMEDAISTSSHFEIVSIPADFTLEGLVTKWKK